MRIEIVDPGSPAACRLLDASAAYMASLYPAESNHIEGVDALRLPSVRFVGVLRDGELVGCGAVKLMEDDGRYGEIKRVYVPDAERGKGISRLIMDDLEGHLRRLGLPLARLETGIHQPEALGLYRSRGYRERTPFGAYRPDPLSVFMEKDLRL